MKNIIVFGIAIAIAVGGIYYFFFAPERPQTPEEKIASLSVGIIAENDHIKGSRDAKTILIEYSDFQCPACGMYQPIVKKLAEELGEKMAIVYRHFPLKQHKNAEIAAYASESADNQGKFWEMHDMIFETQKDWSEKDNAKDIFIGYAEKLGLDRTKFATDIDSDEIEEKVAKQNKSGLKAKVNSTPSFFLNGEKLDSQRTYDEFKKTIEEAIAKTQ